MGCGASLQAKGSNDTCRESCSTMAQERNGDVLETSLGDPMRGLSVAFLASRFLEDMDVNANPDLSVYDIEPKIRQLSSGTCPRDGGEGCAYVDAAPDPDAGKAQCMLSYSWGYRVKDIVATLQRFCEIRGLDPSKTRFWICCLCINQHRVKEALAQDRKVSFEDFAAEFSSRVDAVQTVVPMMTPWGSPRYIQRAWCIFEFSECMRKEKDMLVMMTSQDEVDLHAAVIRGEMSRLFGIIASARIQDAGSFCPADKINILKSIDPTLDESLSGAANSEPIEKVNAAVRKKLQAWFVQVAADMLERSKAKGNIIIDHQEGLRAYGSVARMLIEVASDLPQARQVCRAGLERYSDTSGPSKGEVLYQLGRPDQRQGKIKEAMEHFRAAQAAFEEAGAQDYKDERGEPSYANLMRALGDLYYRQGDYDEALQLLEVSRAAFVAAQVQTGQGWAGLLKQLGMANAATFKFQAAVENYELSRQAYEKAGTTNTPFYAGLLRMMADCEVEQGKYESAVEIIEGRALPLFKSLGLTSSQEYADAVRVAGLSHMGAGDLANALELLKQAEEVLAAMGAKEHRTFPMLLGDIAVCNMRLHRASDVANDHASTAEHYLGMARAGFLEANRANTPEYARFLVQEVECHRAMGQEAVENDEVAEASNLFNALGLTSRNLDPQFILKLPEP